MTVDEPTPQSNSGGVVASANGKAPGSPSKRVASESQWTFPKNSLEDAIRVAQAVEEKYAGNPTPAEQVANAMAFNRVADWRFLDLLRSANQYKLVEGTGATATVKLTDIGQSVVAPSSPDQRKQALVDAAFAVDDFHKVSQFYSGKKLPESEYLENTLVREFKIPRDRVPTFISVYTKNLEYLKAFDSDPSGDKIVRIPAQRDADEAEGRIPLVHEPNRSIEVREFLDTCFVLMPFGPWPDLYFRDIYVPAIKDAGFEPVRADGLFTTGSVIEQIWEQIQKCKVVLAELSGKNPNVFYELGLAHALGKPVVFVADNLDDVPFDLRHLRVVTYEVREPTWAEKLRGDIATYLRNAKAEPERSIPTPFKLIVEGLAVGTTSLRT